MLLQVQQNGRIPGNTVADSMSPAPPVLPIFAKALCCLELFGCCCRRLSQRGVGEVLILLRHCVCVGSGSFCHDWASHCSVLFWSFDALFVFWTPPPFVPLLSGDTFSLVRIRVKFEAVTSFTICPCNVNKKHGLRTSLQHEADEQ